MFGMAVAEQQALLGKTGHTPVLVSRTSLNLPKESKGSEGLNRSLIGEGDLFCEIKVLVAFILNTKV